MDNAGLLLLGLALGVSCTLCIMWTGGRWQTMECGLNNNLDYWGSHTLLEGVIACSRSYRWYPHDVFLPQLYLAYI